MAVEKTFSIIKPEAVKNKISGKIISMFEDNGFNILAQKKIYLTKDQAGKFYAVHKNRPFYKSLVDFMSSGPCIVQVLEKENAISDNRKLMGATNPAEALDGTIRKLYATNIEANAVHGSDSPETAKAEIAFFFSELELVD
ncbi:MAG: nucleoside-diphosphate kinase [Spirochaetota bacterium]|nr:nucleoside-diphosphate kinase [Spirochaetota bacterium]